MLRIGLPRARRVLDREQRRHAAPAPLARRGQPRVRGPARQRDRCASPTRPKGAVDEVQDTPARAPRRRPGQARGCSTAAARRRSRPDRRLLAGHRTARALWSASASTSHGSAGHRGRCPPCPGRNIGVIGADGTDAVRVLGAAAASSLGAQHGTDRRAGFVLAPLVAEAVPTAADVLASRLAAHDAEIVRLDEFAELAADRAPRRRRAAGRAATAPRPTWCSTPADAADTRCRTARGPRRCGRCCGSGRRPACTRSGGGAARQRLRSLLTMSASPDDLGCVPRASTCRAPSSARWRRRGCCPSWSPRPGRALCSTGRGTPGRRSSSSRPSRQRARTSPRTPA